MTIEMASTIMSSRWMIVSTALRLFFDDGCPLYKTAVDP